jgi:hypothetical protein
VAAGAARTSLSGRVLLEAQREGEKTRHSVVWWRAIPVGHATSNAHPILSQTQNKARSIYLVLCAALMKYGAFYVVISRWSGLQDKASSCFLEICMSASYASGLLCLYPRRRASLFINCCAHVDSFWFTQNALLCHFVAHNVKLYFCIYTRNGCHKNSPKRDIVIFVKPAAILRLIMTTIRHSAGYWLWLKSLRSQKSK